MEDTGTWLYHLCGYVLLAAIVIAVVRQIWLILLTGEKYIPPLPKVGQRYMDKEWGPEWITIEGVRVSEVNPYSVQYKFLINSNFPIVDSNLIFTADTEYWPYKLIEESK